jgi:hypothetical protein
MAGATRAVMRGRIQTGYGETSVTYISEADINQWIQEAHDILAQETKYYSRIAKADLVDDQREYDVADLRIIEIHDDGVMVLDNDDYDADAAYTTIRPISYWRHREMERSMVLSGDTYDGQLNTEGTPTRYCWDKGRQSIWLYPQPNYDEDAGLRLYITCCQTIDEDTDTTELPRQFEYLITEYGLYRWYEVDDQHAIARQHLSEFERGKGMLKQYMRELGTSGPTRMPRPGERRIRRH